MPGRSLEESMYFGIAVGWMEVREGHSSLMRRILHEVPERPLDQLSGLVPVCSSLPTAYDDVLLIISEALDCLCIGDGVIAPFDSAIGSWQPLGFMNCRCGRF